MGKKRTWSNKRLQHGNRVKFVNTKQLTVRFRIKRSKLFLHFDDFQWLNIMNTTAKKLPFPLSKELGSDVIWTEPRSTNPDIPSQTAIPRSICAQARMRLMKINRGIIIARQRGSRGGNNFFSRYNTWFCLNHTVQKDTREVLGTSFRFGPTSEILENIQYGGSSAVKTDSQRSRFIPREAWFRVLLTRFAFIVTFEEFLVLYSKQSIYKCLIS